MLLTLTLTGPSALDLSYLLHKNPTRLQSFSLPFGKAHVFYPEFRADRCTAALLLSVDPIGLVRGRNGTSGESFALEQYVNDRPYVANSFLSSAILSVFGTALSGRSKERAELASQDLPLEVHLPMVPCKGEEDILRRLFQPLGYKVTVTPHLLDETFPSWGQSPAVGLTLQKECRLSELLTHLYVLIPVLDNKKHYYVGDDEVNKLLRHGEGWLSSHPERGLITKRYLKHQRSLVSQALDQLLVEEFPEAEETKQANAQGEADMEDQLSLNEQRLEAVLTVLKQSGAKRVLDLGCGEGQLLRVLLQEPSFEQITGMDVSSSALETAQSRLRLDRMLPKQRERIQLVQGSLTYRDKRLQNYDAAAVVEVIEHLDPHRLSTFERVLFEFTRPATIIITTPNAEYNVKFDSLIGGQFRHHDHRFEWTRAEFQAWANKVIEQFHYQLRFLPIGPEDPELGAPTQMAVFSL